MSSPWARLRHDRRGHARKQLPPRACSAPNSYAHRHSYRGHHRRMSLSPVAGSHSSGSWGILSGVFRVSSNSFCSTTTPSTCRTCSPWVTTWPMRSWRSCSGQASQGPASSSLRRSSLSSGARVHPRKHCLGFPRSGAARPAMGWPAERPGTGLGSLLLPSHGWGAGGDSQAAAVAIVVFTHPTRNGPAVTVADRSRDADVAVGRSVVCARGR